MVNISVLVSGGGTNLQALIDAEAVGSLGGGRINAVISSKSGVFALERAEKAGISTYVVEKADYPDRDDFTGAIIETLELANTDLIVFGGFNYALPRLAETYPNRMINVHPALIPSFCGDGYYGLKVHKAALDYGVKLSGATVHFANEQTDGGPIILQKAVEVQADDTPETLQKRIMEQAEWVILPEAVSLFCQGRLEVKGRTVVIS